jgi:2-aminobenzoate-CoA ligase
VVPTGYIDSFARDRLPARSLWPDFLLQSDHHRYPERLNCVTRLLDAWLDRGWSDKPCLFSLTETLTYGQLAERVNRIANVLVKDLGLVPGNRVLLRAANTPTMVAAYLAVMKAGCIAVATMPLLRAKELSHVVEKAVVGLALCDTRLMEEMAKTRALSPRLTRIVGFGTAEAELERLMAKASPHFTACDSAQDDVCLLGFTSGTTGGPKATMHFHRDVLAIADSYGRAVLRANASDRFIGSPPLAFTFGLGGLVIFPFAVGASSVMLERATPDDLLAAIEKFGATVLFTAPTAYRAILAKLSTANIKSLRVCVSAGETLPLATFDAWKQATGITILDGIGATEMLHIFIGSPVDAVRPGATGKPVEGYEAKIVDDKGREVPRGTAGQLAVRGPTGCRYLDDPRQSKYVQDGWNFTGDVYIEDADGYFWYQARSDDMIISSGYNIAGPEVEQALLTHPSVAECAVIGTPDAERGMVVSAFVVVKPGVTADTDLVRALQDHVKAEIAPYKYPRRVEFRDALPKTPTGKLQRSALRDEFK